MRHVCHYQYFSSRYLNNENETTISRYWGSDTPVNCETEGTENICYEGQARRKRSSDHSDYPSQLPRTSPPAPSYDFTGSCIFPYEYKGKTYYECIQKIFGNGDENYWCPTELDYNNQPNNWGRCGENCPSSRLRNGYKDINGYKWGNISPKFASKFNSSNQNLLGISNFYFFKPNGCESGPYEKVGG